jgi:hypothetical protein
MQSHSVVASQAICGAQRLLGPSPVIVMQYSVAGLQKNEPQANVPGGGEHDPPMSTPCIWASQALA